MYPVILTLLFWATAVVAAPKSSSVSSCNADNCLRAVRGSTLPPALATRDCSSYFLATVTPATSTHTVTVTSSPTSTFSPTVTVTGTIVNSVTVTNTQTLTDSDTVTSVSTETDTMTTTVDVDVTTTVTPGIVAITVTPEKKRAVHPDLRAHSAVTLARRQVTAHPSSIPTYASACSGSVRYSTACSCIGITRSTTTAPTPVTTITVTATAVQDLTLTQTSSTTTIQSLTVTNSALETSFTTVTTDTTTTVDVPATVTDTITVATATAAFILKAVGGPFDGQYAELLNAYDGEDDEVLSFSPSSSAATAFHIDAAGHLSVGGYYANIDAGVEHYLFYFDTPATIASNGYVYATCSVLTSGALNCVDQTSTMFQISPSIQYTGEAGDGVELGAYIVSGNTAFSFQAIFS